MDERYQRTAMLLGEEAIGRLMKSSVLICGVGGVGSYIAEGLARCGVGEITLLDFDEVAKSNINRQLVALESTIGRKKAEVMAERIADINPDIKVKTIVEFFSEENADRILSGGYDYIADAIDSVGPKLCLIEEAHKRGISIISSMGTGNKLDPTRFKISDISKTSVCPLAKKVRYELRKRGINHHKVLFSDEDPIHPIPEIDGRHVPGSVSFTPSVGGLIIVGEIIKDLIKKSGENRHSM
ncbi:MAG: tRNA threonylcarbamoyladenosine dehydratase [Clostridiaceae bacterium]|nr:tRNA threonylcarbamoyladenosine dehydratase [Clostridiaceae bacterium]